MLRTTLSALVALVAAILLGLDNPYWAAMTTVVVAQPVRGQVMVKGLFRAVGTVLGAAVGVAILLTMGSSPWALIGVLALWIGGCTAVANLVHGYRAYGAVLAAVTSALVVLMAFSHPGAALALSVVRTSEVLLGIVVAAFVALLFLPASDLGGLLHQAWRIADDGVGWAAGVLRAGYGDEAVERERRLVVDMANLVDAAGQIAAGSRRFAGRVRHVRGLMASVLSLMAAARALALHASRSGEEGSDDMRAELERLDGTRAWLREAAPGGHDRGEDDASSPAPEQSTTVAAAVGTDGHLGDLGVALASIRTSYQALCQRSPAPGGEPAVHRDRSAATRTGIRTVVTVLLAGAIWLTTGWDGGGPMVMACAIMCAIFATHPMPARGVRSSLAGAALAFVAALLVRGVLLPEGAGAIASVLILALVLVVGTLAIANRPTAIVGTEFTMMFMFMTEPGLPWTHPPSYLPVTGGGIMVGVTIATIVFALVLPQHPERRLRDLSRAVVRDLQRLATANSRPLAQRWQTLVQHRVLRLMVSAGSNGHELGMTVDGGLAAITVGGALARMHAVEHGGLLPPSAVAAVGRARRAVGAVSLDPGRAATIVRESVFRVGCIPAAGSTAADRELRRATLALVEVAESIEANPRFFAATNGSAVWRVAARVGGAVA